MSARLKKILLLCLAVVLLAGSGRMQKLMNRDREVLGLTRMDALENAPPVLAFTTVALGGFRGLISNFLWIRANDLQNDDKYFEAAQLATWITDLEPHFTQVWTFQAWNMAYNISVKFKENNPGVFADRWRWVENGIELLRDQGLRYNPDDTVMYQQLAWFFQHKMGQNLDDANLYYKQQWIKEMAPLFGADGADFASLLQPNNTNAMVLRTKYKIDPAFAEKMNVLYGPLDWRLPEAHAIYWGAYGLEKAKAHPDKVKAEELIQLRRNIYQSMLQAFYHGRFIADPFAETYSLGPNLDLIPKVNDAYETMMQEDPQNRDHIAIAHRNFLRNAVYFLYGVNRVADAEKWFRLLGEKYPDKPIIDRDPNSLPRNVSLDDYAVTRFQEDVGDTSQERTTADVQALLAQGYYALAIGQNDRYAGFRLLAIKIYQHYQAAISDVKSNQQRIGLPPFADLDRAVLDRMLDPQHEVMPYAIRAVIRSQLGMPGETNQPVPLTLTTNAPVPAVSTETNAAPAGK